MRKVLWVLSFLITMGIDIHVKAEEVLHDEKSLIQDQKLLSGTHWVRDTKNYNLETPYGNIQSIRGDFFVRYEANKVILANHIGKLTIKLRDGGFVEVPAGFQVWISEIQENKKNKIGQIEPVELKEHITTLGKIWKGEPEEFKEVMLKFQSRWGDRTLAASQYYKSLALRKIAAVEENEERTESAKRKEYLRRAANKKMMFERTFGR